MTGNVIDMPKKSDKPKKEGKKPFPSRLAVKYVQIPKEYWEAFEAMTLDGEKYEGRSVAFLVKIACRASLQAEGKVDAKGKLIEKPEGLIQTSE